MANDVVAVLVVVTAAYICVGVCVCLLEMPYQIRCFRCQQHREREKVVFWNVNTHTHGERERDFRKTDTKQEDAERIDR